MSSDSRDKKTLFFKFLSVFCFATLAWGNQSHKKLDSTLSPYILNAMITTSTDTSRFSNPLKSYSSDLELLAGYRFKDQSLLSLYLAASKDLNGLRKQKLQDGMLNYSKEMAKFNQQLSFVGSLRTYIPLSENSQKTTSLITKVRLRIAANITASHNISIQPAIYGLRGIYQFERASDGSSNTQYQVGTTTLFSYNLNDQVNFQLGGGYHRYWTFEGNQKGDKFSLTQEISYQIISSFGVGLGHSNLATALRDGFESNIRLGDSQTSTYYAFLTYDF